MTLNESSEIANIMNTIDSMELHFVLSRIEDQLRKIYDSLNYKEDIENIEEAFDLVITGRALLEELQIKGFYKTLVFDNMLYPDSKKAFDTTISVRVFRDLKLKAFKLLLEADNDVPLATINHWKDLVDGKVPFGYRVDYNLGE